MLPILYLFYQSGYFNEEPIYLEITCHDKCGVRGHFRVLPHFWWLCGFQPETEEELQASYKAWSNQLVEKSPSPQIQ